MGERRIKFLHLADVHLDTVFQNREAKMRALLREAGREAFRAGVDLALAADCHALLISGDLFDNQTLSFTTEKFLLTEMQRLAQGQVQVFYATGNHDPAGSKYRAQKIRWPNNVHIFAQRTPKAYPLLNSEGQTIAMIVGAGHENSRESENLATSFPAVQNYEVPSIAVLHALVTGSSSEAEHERYAPCTLLDLTEKGYVYWALGHVHRRGILSESPHVVYPGNLLGRNPRENGIKGAYLVEIDDYGQVEIDFYPLAPLCWHDLTINNLAEADNLEKLEQLIVRAVEVQLKDKLREEKILLRLKLIGPCPLYRELAVAENLAALTENLTPLLSLEYLELNAEGVFPPLYLGRYRDEPHILSELLNLISALTGDEAKLLELAPERLAGCPQNIESKEKINYLYTLLQGLDYEAVARLVEVEE
ncbi:MAG TPA: DNA repair exonuclease [Clostridia bacterium]|jgi:exonuclease SbcD|nr:DNA repair exonuclease [Clostridia bacterium]HHY05651.1 DNA repair exonuclease [Clostridia bacterium]